MSESSSELGAAGRKRSVDELVERLRAKTLAERLPLLAHLSIGRTLCKLRDAIVNNEPVSAKSAKALLCYRRITNEERLNIMGLLPEYEKHLIAHPFSLLPQWYVYGPH